MVDRDPEGALYDPATHKRGFVLKVSKKRQELGARVSLR